ncbi:hypothetical protein [Ferirhizobium litorale]|uniref:Uncharacterized protein n=1 Tax=Ferirhizobium litorale TaxID=2927786 RepID=A0AAE3U469_9HYPH|nr:hypothetical protein [Fererhizobium litorale]MDI7924567.1 hypothetical protein [Fererhizobium litorale]
MHALIERSAPYSPVAVRDVAQELANFMLDNPGATESDALKTGRWSLRQIERFGPAALTIAASKIERRI